MEKIMKDYITDIIIHYVKAVHENSGLDDDYSALVIIDNFQGQLIDGVVQLLEDNNIHLVKLPCS